MSKLPHAVEAPGLLRRARLHREDQPEASSSPPLPEPAHAEYEAHPGARARDARDLLACVHVTADGPAGPTVRSPARTARDKNSPVVGMAKPSRRQESFLMARDARGHDLLGSGRMCPEPPLF